MVVRIRFTRLGCRNHPFYRIIATDSKATRDGKHIEVLGYYNPTADKDDARRMALRLERVKYWLSVGAQPSEPVQSLLLRAGLLPPSPMEAMKREGADQNEDDGVSPEAIFSIGLPVN